MKTQVAQERARLADWRESKAGPRGSSVCAGFGFTVREGDRLRKTVLNQ